MHPVYKVSLEFYIWAGQGTWESIFHFTLGNNGGDGHRHPALWTDKQACNSEGCKLHVTASVSGNAGFTIFPIVDKDTWNSIEYGVVLL